MLNKAERFSNSEYPALLLISAAYNEQNLLDLCYETEIFRRNYMRRLIFCLAGAVLLVLPSVTLAQEVTSDTPRQVLFVGNSYFYYNDSLHNHLNRMLAEAEGRDDDDLLPFRSIAISGGSLSHHPFAHYMAPGAIGYDEPFDAVVLAGHSAAGNSDDRRTAFREAVLTANEVISEHGAKTVLYMTHAYGEGHEDYDPEMMHNLASLYTEVGAEIDATVIPVGLAFAKAYEQRPDLKLHVEFDHSHPNLAGSYLAAATALTSLYDISPVGLTYDYYGRLDTETTTFLQEIAADTVAEFSGS